MVELTDHRPVRRIGVGGDDHDIAPIADRGCGLARIRHGPADRDRGGIGDRQARRRHRRGDEIGIWRKRRAGRDRRRIVAFSRAGAARAGGIGLAHLAVEIGGDRDLELARAGRSLRQGENVLLRPRGACRDRSVARHGGIVEHIPERDDLVRRDVADHHVGIERAGHRGVAAVLNRPVQRRAITRTQSGRRRQGEIGDLQVRRGGRHRGDRQARAVVALRRIAAASPRIVELEHLVEIVGGDRELDLAGAAKADRKRIADLARTTVARRNRSVSVRRVRVDHRDRIERFPRGQIPDRDVVVPGAAGRRGAQVAVVPMQHDAGAGLQPVRRLDRKVGCRQIRVGSDRRAHRPRAGIVGLGRSGRAELEQRVGAVGGDRDLNLADATAAVRQLTDVLPGARRSGGDRAIARLRRVVGHIDRGECLAGRQVLDDDQIGPARGCRLRANIAVIPANREGCPRGEAGRIDADVRDLQVGIGRTDRRQDQRTRIIGLGRTVCVVLNENIGAIDGHRDLDLADAACATGQLVADLPASRTAWLDGSIAGGSGIVRHEQRRERLASRCVLDHDLVGPADRRRPRAGVDVAPVDRDRTARCHAGRGGDADGAHRQVRIGRDRRRDRRYSTVVGLARCCVIVFEEGIAAVRGDGHFDVADARGPVWQQEGHLTRALPASLDVSVTRGSRIIGNVLTDQNLSRRGVADDDPVQPGTRGGGIAGVDVAPIDDHEIAGLEPGRRVAGIEREREIVGVTVIVAAALSRHRQRQHDLACADRDEVRRRAGQQPRGVAAIGRNDRPDCRAAEHRAIARHELGGQRSGVVLAAEPAEITRECETSRARIDRGARRAQIDDLRQRRLCAVLAARERDRAAIGRTGVAHGGTTPAIGQKFGRAGDGPTREWIAGGSGFGVPVRDQIVIEQAGNAGRRLQRYAAERQPAHLQVRIRGERRGLRHAGGVVAADGIGFHDRAQVVDRDGDLDLADAGRAVRQLEAELSLTRGATGDGTVAGRSRIVGHRAADQRLARRRILHDDKIVEGTRRGEIAGIVHGPLHQNRTTRLQADSRRQRQIADLQIACVVVAVDDADVGKLELIVV